MAGGDNPNPGPSRASKETQHPELSVRSSSLLHELTSLPLLKSLGSLYTATRDSHWLLKSGLGMFEDTCSVVIDKLHIGSAFAIKMDKTAGEGITKLKERYPSITTPTDEIYSYGTISKDSRFIRNSGGKRAINVRVTEGLLYKMVQSSKDQGAFLFHKTVRKIFRTYPGHIALSIFDWSVDKADRLLRRMSPPVRSPRKRKVTRASVKKIQEEHAYASEDSGACEATEKLSKKPKAPETTGKKTEAPTGLLSKLFRLGVVFPIEVSVSALKRVRRYLHAVSQRKRKLEKINGISPEKEREIKARRKVSPKKKKPVSLLDQVRQSAFSVLGYKGVRVRQIQIEKSESDIPNREEADKKRKHDEILTDQGSEEESDDDDLVDFDLDNYESEDDPDYEPSDSDVISEDISDAETESDIETEDVGERGYFVQLKEKPREKQHGEHKSAEITHEPSKDSKSSSSEKSFELVKDKTGKPDEKVQELPKDSKHKPQHSDKTPEPSKDNKDKKVDIKSPGLPKDAKSKGQHTEKLAEPSKDKKQDTKSQEWSKETMNKTPRSDKLPGFPINGDKKPESADKHKAPQGDKKPELSKESKGKAALENPQKV